MKPSAGSFSKEIARADFQGFVAEATFPCLGARAAVNSNAYLLFAYEEMAEPATTRELARDLGSFTGSSLARTNEYASFVAVFRGPDSSSEIEFERLLWRQLQALNELDAKTSPWSPASSPNVADPNFSFSFGGESLYVVGMHGQSSRLARRFRWPALVFNPHAQFQRLRASGRWQRMQNSIREREVALQGSRNPMLSDFGERSEARQYSGRAVDDGWAPDFAPKAQSAGRCPFGH